MSSPDDASFADLHMPPNDLSEPVHTLLQSRVKYHARHRIAVCLLCGHCYVPGPEPIRRHLAKHKQWPRSERKAMGQLLAQFDLAQPEELHDIAVDAVPIAGLTIHCGWACQACSYASKEDSSMQEHNRTVHQWARSSPIQWHAAKVQTLFVGPRRHYLSVGAIDTPESHLVSDLETSIASLLAKGKSHDEQEAEENHRVAENGRHSDYTPWMRKTRWTIKFASYNLRTIAASTEKPADPDGVLRAVWRAVGRCLDQCRNSIRTWRMEVEDGDLVLRWLESPHPTDLSPKPFTPDHLDTTHQKYINHWARCICYLLRLTQVEGHHGQQFDIRDRTQLEAIWAVADAGDDEAALDVLIMQFSVHLCMHENRGQSRSPLVHCCAALGVNNQTLTWHLPPTYGQILAALLYCVRLLVFEHALPQATRGALPDQLSAFRAIRDMWLVDGRPTPFNYMNNLLAYALGVGRDIGALPRVQWATCKNVLLYQGLRLPLERLRHFMSSMCEQAEGLLYRELGAMQVRHDFKDIVDDMNERAVGYSFLSDPRNGLSQGRETILRRLTAETGADALFRLTDTGLETRTAAWRQYQHHLTRFMKIMFILIHICSGAPARGVEILSSRWKNANVAPRNIYIIDGTVTFVTAYHKSQAITGQHRVIARFLPPRIGRLLVSYLVEVRPLCQLIDANIIEKASGTFLWADRQGVWNTSQASQFLALESARHTDVRITFQDWRHIAKAIDREHVRTLSDEEVDMVDDIHDLAFAHSSTTADNVYAIDASMLRSLTSRTLTAFRGVSHQWHRFWHMQASSTTPSHALTRRASTALEPPTSKRTLSGGNVKNVAGRRHFSDDIVRAGLTSLLGPGSEFKSSSQREAVGAILRDESPLVIILPPGGGKSLLFQLPATLPSATCTLVVVPFRALIDDLVQRSRCLGIRANIWEKQLPSNTQLLFVSAETAAVNDDFMTSLVHLQSSGRLDRIVIDECHVVLTTQSYRQQLIHLNRLRAVPCQIVFLTGTLPPKMERSLEDMFLLRDIEQGPRYVRAGTNRANITYSIEIHESDARDSTLRTVVETHRAVSPDQRCLIFCRTRVVSEAIAQLLQCQPYHRAKDGKEGILNAWCNGDEMVMVATTALGTGVDVPDVNLVIHVGIPYGIIDYVQEAGRGGRNQQPAVSMILIDHQDMAHVKNPRSEEQDWNKESLRLFIATEHCRRALLVSVMDGTPQPCDPTVGERCDICMTSITHDVEDVPSCHDLTVSRSGVDEDLILPSTPSIAISPGDAQAQRHTQGPRLYAARTREQATDTELIIAAGQLIGHECTFCWMHELPRQHKTAGCPGLQRVLGTRYLDVRRDIHYHRQSYCCYRCGLPADWCPDFCNKQTCTQGDVIPALVISAWCHNEAGALIRREFKVATIRECVQKIGEPTSVAGIRSATGVKMAVTFIRTFAKLLPY